MLDQTLYQGVGNSEKITGRSGRVRRHDHCDRTREENLDDSLSACSPSRRVQFTSSDTPAQRGAKYLVRQGVLHSTKQIYGRGQQVQANIRMGGTRGSRGASRLEEAEFVVSVLRWGEQGVQRDMHP